MPPNCHAFASGLNINSGCREPSSTFSAPGSPRTGPALGCPGTPAAPAPPGTKPTWRSRPLPPPSSQPLPPLQSLVKGFPVSPVSPRPLLPEGRVSPLVRGRPLQGRGPVLRGRDGPFRGDGPAWAGMLSSLPGWSPLHWEDPPSRGRAWNAQHGRLPASLASLALVSVFLQVQA